MLPLLASGVQPAVINAAGVFILFGGLALTFGWLAYLYR
jgi:hypothetical protein